MARRDPLPNDLGGHLANWLRRVGYNVQTPKEVVFVDDFGDFTTTIPGEDEPSSANDPRVGALSGAMGVHIGPSWQPSVSRLAQLYGDRNRPMDQADLDAVDLLNHELIHQLRVKDGGWAPGYTTDDLLWEEAAAQQAADDLRAAVAKQMFGHTYKKPRMPKWPDRHEDVRRAQSNPDRRDRQIAYRQLSVFGSGAGKYTDRDARLWRRKFANVGGDERARMIQEATNRRLEWGKKTGR